MRVECPHRFATIDKGKQTYSPMKATLRTHMGGEYTHIWELRRPPCVVDPQVENEGNALQEECAGCAGCKAIHAGGEVIPLKETGAAAAAAAAAGAGAVVGEGGLAGLVTFKTSDQPHTHVYQSPRSASARQQQQQQQQHADIPPSKGGAGRAAGAGILDQPQRPYYFELDSKMAALPVQQEGTTMAPQGGGGGGGGSTLQSDPAKSTSSC